MISFTTEKGVHFARKGFPPRISAVCSVCRAPTYFTKYPRSAEWQSAILVYGIWYMVYSVMAHGSLANGPIKGVNLNMREVFPTSFCPRMTIL